MTQLQVSNLSVLIAAEAQRAFDRAIPGISDFQHQMAPGRVLLGLANALLEFSKTLPMEEGK